MFMWICLYYNSLFNYLSLSGLLVFSILLLIVEEGISHLLGLWVLVINLNLYLISVGYILLPLLFLVCVSSISIVILVCLFNNIYNCSLVQISWDIFMFVLIIYMYMLLVDDDICGLCILGMYELLSYIYMFNSNILYMYILYIVCILMIVWIGFSSSDNINVNFSLYFNLGIMVLCEILLLSVVGILICYIPILISYSSVIYNWSEDIYSVGIGNVYMCSIYMCLGNDYMVNNVIYVYVYMFIYLDNIICVIVYLYMFSITNWLILYTCILMLIICYPIIDVII